MDLNVLATNITRWAEDRNLIEGSNPPAQFVKLVEEVGELAAGIARKNFTGVKDGIGDAFVVLTILAAQHDISVAECVEHAWNEIKRRRGRMVDGVFVKEEDE